MAREFKVGDRVIGIEKYGSKKTVDIKGTIVGFQYDFNKEISYVNICWDENIDGHDGLQGECKKDMDGMSQKII